MDSTYRNQVLKKSSFKNYRWVIIFLFITGVTLNYITRNSLGIMAPELKQTFQMSNEQYSVITMAFQIAYTIFQPLCGWFIDVVGTKIGFAICAIAWSLVCMFHAGVGSWMQLAFLRFFMGSTEAAAAPANVKVMTEWFPKKERTIANGWGGVGFSIGGMVAPPLIYLLHANFGWQAAFVVPGIAGIIWAIVWFKMYDTPATSKIVSEEERDYILADQDPPFEGKKPSLWTSLGGLLTTKKFYGIGIPAFLSEPAWQALGFWVPLYMAQVHGFKLIDIAMFAWVPFLMADLGSLAAGYLVPILRNRFNMSRLNASIVTSFIGAVVMVCLVFAAFSKNPYVAVLLISMGGFGHQMISGMLGVLVMETTPSHQVATANGLRGTFAWTAAFLSTFAIGQLTSEAIFGASGFTYAFVFMGLFDLIGVAIMAALLWERKKTKTALA